MPALDGLSPLSHFLELGMRDMISLYVVLFFLLYALLGPLVTEPATPEGGKKMSPRKLVIVCLVHSTIAVVGACYVLFRTSPGDDPMSLIPAGSEPFLRCTLGYLVFDIIFMVWNRKNVPLEASVILHHVNTFFAIFIADYYKVGLYFCGYLALNEASSLPMHVMRLISNRAAKSILKVVFAISFILFRTLMLPALLYHLEVNVIENSTVDRTVVEMERKAFWLHVAINWYWTYMVVRMAMKSKSPKKEH